MNLLEALDDVNHLALAQSLPNVLHIVFNKLTAFLKFTLFSLQTTTEFPYYWETDQKVLQLEAETVHMFQQFVNLIDTIFSFIFII